ncbi:MAG: ABC transporter permease subunit [Chloroflexi bacterium]|nr:ABC transporter permease subunit [Chloroflexota bacterium]
MRNTITIAGKEFKSYLASPMAYIVTGIFLIATGFFFSISPATYTETSINGFLQAGVILLLLFAPLLTMRLLAEERKLGTIELLLTAPVRDSEIILGKFLGGLGILTVMLGLTLYYPLLLIIFGDPDMGPIGAGYLGLLLLGYTALAIGIFTSSLTSNQIVAAVVAIGILLALYFVGFAASFLPEALGEVIGYFSLSNYFPDFMRGIVDTRGIIYYLSITALFLFLAIRSLENSRWS